jgi:hypothetical protein
LRNRKRSFSAFGGPAAPLGGRASWVCCLPITLAFCGQAERRASCINWPVAVNFNESAQCSMIDCRVIINDTTIATAAAPIAVQIGDSASNTSAIETYIAGCYFYDETSLGTGMQIYGCEHLRVMNTRIEYGRLDGQTSRSRPMRS